MAIGLELMERAAEIGRILSREEGKPAAEGRGEPPPGQSGRDGTRGEGAPDKALQ